MRIRFSYRSTASAVPAAPPTFEEVHQGGSAGSNTVTTATSVLGVNGHVYLAAVGTRSVRLFQHRHRPWSDMDARGEPVRRA